MASPSFSSAPGGFKYDVFLSYRGKDTFKTLTSHLYKALAKKNINTFRDYQLERGEEIAPGLLEAIEESKLSVVIFSQNYASSTWCLDELAHILECKERYQQKVIPIFYEVDPSHVRFYRESFASAFVQHEQRFKDTPDKVLKWKDSLTKVSELAGFDSRNNSHDSELVEQVVEDIAMKLNCEGSGKVEIESHIQLFIAQEFSSRPLNNGTKLDSYVAEDECLRCGWPGHWAKDCPLAGDQEMYRMKMGREAYSSSGRSNSGSGDRSSLRRNVCFKCRGLGHWARDCPSVGDQVTHGLSQAGGEDSNNDYTDYSYGGRRSTYWDENVCYNCGGRGHWQQVCPSANGGSDNDSN